MCRLPIGELIDSGEVSFLDASGIVTTGASTSKPLSLSVIESNLFRRAKLIAQREEPSRHAFIKLAQPRVSTDCYLIRRLGITAVEALCGGWKARRYAECGDGSEAG